MKNRTRQTGEWSVICTRPTLLTLAWASGRALMSNPGSVILFYFLNSLVNCGSIWNIKLLLNLVGRILKTSFFSATDRKQHGQVLKPLWMTKQNIIFYILFSVIIVINIYITVIIVIMDAKEIEIIKTSESIKIFLCSKQGFRKSLNWPYA